MQESFNVCMAEYSHIYQMTSDVSAGNSSQKHLKSGNSWNIMMKSWGSIFSGLKSKTISTLNSTLNSTCRWQWWDHSVVPILATRGRQIRISGQELREGGHGWNVRPEEPESSSPPDLVDYIQNGFILSTISIQAETISKDGEKKPSRATNCTKNQLKCRPLHPGWMMSPSSGWWTETKLPTGCLQWMSRPLGSRMASSP